MVKCKQLGLPVPLVYHVDLKEAKIYMEHIHGITVKEFLYQNECDSKESLELATNIGNILAKIHNESLG
jgi:tRNA A-37 threonylcarbamoyl transferase component Bud32